MRFPRSRPAPLRGCTPFPSPVALPPRIASRPVRWRSLLPALRSLREEPSNTELAFEMFELVGGRGDEGLFRSFAVTAEGRALLRERPGLLLRLVDREALAALPEGSFGRAYLEFARENGFAADGLLETRDRAFAGLDDEIGPERRWFFDRLTLSHDLWHVLTGYGTDEAGELALLGFSRAQGLNGRVVSLFALFGGLIGGIAVQRQMFQAWRRGRRAACLVVQRWEELLPLPLDQVRRRLSIVSVAEAHPKGLLRVVDQQLVRGAA